MKPAIALTALALSACATPQGPKVIHVPTPVSCVAKDFPDPPAGLETRESLATAPDAASLTQRLYADWKARFAWMAEAGPVIAACR